MPFYYFDKPDHIPTMDSSVFWGPVVSLGLPQALPAELWILFVSKGLIPFSGKFYPTVFKGLWFMWINLLRLHATYAGHAWMGEGEGVGGLGGGWGLDKSQSAPDFFSGWF